MTKNKIENEGVEFFSSNLFKRFKKGVIQQINILKYRFFILKLINKKVHY